MRTAQLSEVAKLDYGFAFDSKQFNTDGRGLPLVRIRDVVRGRSDTYYSGEYADRYLVKDGDYLIGMDGQFNLARWRGGQALLNQRVCRIGDLDASLDRAYLARFMPLALKAIEDATPFVTVKHLSAKALNAIDVPLPSLPEQRRIAAILDHADALRAKRRQVLTHLDALARSIFHDMFGDVAADRTVGEVGEIQGGLQVSSKRASLPVEVPYLRVANVHRGRLDLTQVKTLRATEAEIGRTRLHEGDLLFVEGHANPNEVGRVAVWNGEIETCVHQNHLIRARLDESRALPVFAAAWLNTDHGASHFRRAGKTTSGLNTISASTVRGAPLPLPPIDDQREFAAKVDLVTRQQSDVWHALAADDRLYASLQSRAFRGEL